ncbi:hypothetical protein [Actinoallomurus sp. NPDC052274]|uniref:hypothetical protein n=1 Tax=Actinoallomurus sp. NPDC052274 TaxID=3155420 RepID=UPI00344A5DD9
MVDTSNTPPPEPERPDWRDMAPGRFDKDAPDVPLSLFPIDPCGTEDLGLL